MKNKLLKKIAVLSLAGIMAASVAACGSSNSANTENTQEENTEDAQDTDDTKETEDADKAEEVVEPVADAVLEDGFYTVDFTTDSSMFHVNDEYNGKGTMIVSEVP